MMGVRIALAMRIARQDKLLKQFQVASAALHRARAPVVVMIGCARVSNMQANSVLLQPEELVGWGYRGGGTFERAVGGEGIVGIEPAGAVSSIRI